MEENKYLIKFEKPYTHEGKEYTELDLSGIEKLNGQMMSAIEKQFVTSGNVPVMMEFTIEYAFIVANHVCPGFSMEFFYGLPAPECWAIKNMVTSFFGKGL